MNEFAEHIDDNGEHEQHDDETFLHTGTMPTTYFTIVPYQPDWPVYFGNVAAELSSDLADADVKYQTIEHIGSTSVPGMTSKAMCRPLENIWRAGIIDVCIVMSVVAFTEETRRAVEEALRWGHRQGGYQYIGDGGVEDRWSFKLQGDIVPVRNVYVVAAGSLPHRAYLSVRRVLRAQAGIHAEYRRIKAGAGQEFGARNDELGYCRVKRPFIRKMLIHDGWTPAEVDEAEARSRREWPEETPADYYE